MPRQPDPDLEERILKAAHALWRRGGDKALTLRAVAQAAGTNTPAVYRRFRNRRELVRGLLGITVARIGKIFAAGATIEQMTEAYVDLALEQPREFELFYTHAREMAPPKRSGVPKPIRESRPNFALLEQTVAKRVGGSPEDHTRLALALWATIHGTSVILLSRGIEGHEEELRSACRTAVKTMIDAAANFSEKK
jgi:AcrR family transcriptional regulator